MSLPLFLLGLMKKIAPLCMLKVPDFRCKVHPCLGIPYLHGLSWGPQSFVGWEVLVGKERTNVGKFVSPLRWICFDFTHIKVQLGGESWWISIIIISKWIISNNPIFSDVQRISHKALVTLHGIGGKRWYAPGVPQEVKITMHQLTSTGFFTNKPF